MRFKDWLKHRMLSEMMVSVGSIVSCKDLNNNDFQVQGSASNLGCKIKKNKILKMKFKGDK